jgi:hypothetical protein
MAVQGNRLKIVKEDGNSTWDERITPLDDLQHCNSAPVNIPAYPGNIR